MYLLDTNVVSELRRHKPHGAVLQWFNQTDDSDLHLSAVTIGEIQAGIEITREQDAVKASELEEWLALVSQTYNVLALDGRIFREWARLMHRKPGRLIEDAMIAATASVHRLTIVTRNIRDFDLFRVEVFDPFQPDEKPDHGD